MEPSIGNLLDSASHLKSISDSPALDVQLMLCHVLEKSPSYVYSHREHLLSDNQMKTFTRLLTRRQQGEPVAYLTGKKGFWNIEFSVNPNVLVPRPETEVLVERVLALDRNQIDSVLDLGTGSGAIAISLAMERPGWTLTATDISQQAIDAARSNALAHAVDIHFIKGHWCNPLLEMQFDVIVSNPPYIKMDDPHLTQAELQYEPTEALVSGVDGLAALQEIIVRAKNHLNSGGRLILEHGYDQCAAVCTLLDQCGYSGIEIYKDYTGIDRAVEARWGGISSGQI